jgi:hypothetical protein
MYIISLLLPLPVPNAVLITVSHSHLIDDTVMARNLDLLPAGMVVKLHLHTIRTSLRDRNGVLGS